MLWFFSHFYRFLDVFENKNLGNIFIIIPSSIDFDHDVTTTHHASLVLYSYHPFRVELLTAHSIQICGVVWKQRQHNIT